MCIPPTGGCKKGCSTLREAAFCVLFLRIFFFAVRAVELDVFPPFVLAHDPAVAVGQRLVGLPGLHRAVLGGQHQHPEPCIEEMLGPAGVNCAAAGIEAQTADGHRPVVRLFGALGLDEDGFCTLLVGGQSGQQLCAHPRAAVGGQDGEIVQLAHFAARGPHHQQVGHQRVLREHAPCVGHAGGLAVQYHAQRLQLAGREVAAHLVQIHPRQLVGGEFFPK